VNLSSTFNIVFLTQATKKQVVALLCHSSLAKQPEFKVSLCRKLWLKGTQPEFLKYLIEVTTMAIKRNGWFPLIFCFMVINIWTKPSNAQDDDGGVTCFFEGEELICQGPGFGLAGAPTVSATTSSVNYR